MKTIFNIFFILISYSSFAQPDTNARGKIIIPEWACQGNHFLSSTYISGDTVVVTGQVHTNELYMPDSVVVKEVYF